MFIYVVFHRFFRPLSFLSYKQRRKQKKSNCYLGDEFEISIQWTFLDQTNFFLFDLYDKLLHLIVWRIFIQIGHKGLKIPLQDM